MCIYTKLFRSSKNLTEELLKYSEVINRRSPHNTKPPSRPRLTLHFQRLEYSLKIYLLYTLHKFDADKASSLVATRTLHTVTCVVTVQRGQIKVRCIKCIRKQCIQSLDTILLTGITHIPVAAGYIRTMRHLTAHYSICVAGSVATCRYADDSDDSESRYHEESSDRSDAQWPSDVVPSHKRHAEE